MHKQIWLAYANEQQQWLIALAFSEGMTVQMAIEQSGIVQQAQLDLPLSEMHIGIFGVKVADLQQQVQAGDRIEIYRPLKINPKDIRRNRAEKNPTSRYLVKQRARGNRFKHGE
ncbi:MAG: RnfH family protein [Acinetobacter sp.]|nr:RnfH family protein [Acinetobacter sp.]